MALTEGEKLRAQRLYAEHQTFQRIAKILGRRMQDVCRSLASVHPKKKKRLYLDDLEGLKSSRIAAGLNARPVEPPVDLIVERELRRAAPARDLTGEIMHDPPLGYSALDRYMAAHAAK